ncbi:MAG: DUF2079 domain-containing protein [Candidatus Limnocylindria bacterium]
MKGWTPASAWFGLGALLAGVLGAVWAGSLLLSRARGLATAAYDLAFFQQLVWRIGHDGAWLTSFDDGSFLGLHFSPMLAVPAAIQHLVGHDARWLTVIHAAAVGALAPATFLFVRAALRPSRHAGLVALGLAVPAPFWAISQEITRADFHPELVGIVLALLAGWAGLTGRVRIMWLSAGLALTAREDVAYAVLAAALVVAAVGAGRRARRHGRLLAVIAIVWGIAIFGVVMPAIRGDAVVDTARYYAWLGRGPEIVLAPFTLTGEIIAALTRPQPWFVVAGLGITLLGLPLLRPRWLLLMVPPLTATLLSSHLPQASLILHYPVILIVPALAAAAMGARRGLAVLGRHGRRQRRRGGRPLVRAGVLAAMTAPALVVATVQGALPPFDDGGAWAFAQPAAIAPLRAVAAQAPSDARLVVDEGTAAPLASRLDIALITWPRAGRPTDYVLLDRSAWSPSRWATDRRLRVATRVQGQGRPVLADDGRFLLLGPIPEAGP